MRRVEARADDPPLLRLEGIRKSFATGTTALRDLDLAIRHHEFMSLLGPSGCGKSTILRLIAGLSAPSGGRLSWDGSVDAGAIGFVFQEPTLMPWTTVFANVYLPLRLQGVSRRRARPRVDEALSMVGLSPFAQAYPRELSGGMKMRVSIARALVTRPRLLLMDEPFAALDEITRFRLNDDLLSLWQEQSWTVVFVTHSVFESVYLSDRVLVMAPSPGRIVEEVGIKSARPRGPDFRTSQTYNELCRRVSASLRQAMGG